MLAATTLRRCVRVEGVNLTALAEELTRQASTVQAGDLSRAEEMLSAQAHTLDAIFNQLPGRAVNAEYLPQLETFLKLALRAQSQARATWEAVSAIQNPPLAGYIEQANIAGGHQQINNGSRARETESAPTQLLEQVDGNRLESGTAGAGSAVDPTVATVGAVHRTEDAGG